jgi:DNA oxidative demethylase
VRQGSFEFAATPAKTSFAPGAWWLRGFACGDVDELLRALDVVTAAAPFRHMQTPGGHTMSVAMTNCGALGWISGARGYRYGPDDPMTNAPWPAMPAAFAGLATRAAAAAGYAGFRADACLVNRYESGARLTRHQDRNERDFAAPIVSVSLGLPATFVFGGDERSAPAQRLALQHGDVLVWGGASRLAFHGVLPVRDGNHPLLGRCRINLTFRVAG